MIILCMAPFCQFQHPPILSIPTSIFFMQKYNITSTVKYRPKQVIKLCVNTIYIHVFSNKSI